MKINSLDKQKHGYLINTWSDKDFKGTVVNQALLYLREWSLKITLTVPVTSILKYLNSMIFYVIVMWY